ncbi:Ninja-family protein AFP3 [Citrus sinensis]|uniref:ninja-family protein AFP3 isoform X2 n=1 Tax=Citrus sinensis TaxID=2711 RepID=UPI0003D77C68|nr:ninja-family protein AFP3 isoform X2 [Citrus sinensis]KAH9676775.1 Ninja-family protein AFP3 [Citrus sinensis]
MAKAEEIGSREAEKHVSVQVSNFPKDLLQRFMTGGNDFDAQEGSEETEEIELSLSLGLSLNGRFGVDPKTTTRANNNIQKLARSSSIPDFMNPFFRDQNDTSFLVPMDCANLTRTCSLPTETEEEWRKRKELQSLRRMQAKRKRTEKQRHLKITARDRISRVSVCGEEVNGIVNQMETHCGVRSQSLVNGVTTKGACASANVLKGGGTAIDAGFLPPAPQAANGSSLASGVSSGISELDSITPQGSHKCTEAVSPSIIQSMQPPRNTEVATSEKSGKSMAVKSHCNKPTVAKKGVKEAVRDVLEDMPCVSTTGDGPDGKRIEGFLYRYRKGEEVRIVCVCHGSFLSPAEFVKHAGGGDVAHPLKHIVVNPYPIL